MVKIKKILKLSIIILIICAILALCFAYSNNQTTAVKTITGAKSHKPNKPTATEPTVKPTTATEPTIVKEDTAQMPISEPTQSIAPASEAATPQPTVTITLDPFAQSIFTLINEYRTQNSLNTLVLNSMLVTSAQNRSEYLCKTADWGHIQSDGTSWAVYISSAGYNYKSAGENLARDFFASQGTMTGWQNSPSHNENMLKTYWEDIGIGYSYCDGRNYVVTHFGYL